MVVLTVLHLKVGLLAQHQAMLLRLFAVLCLSLARTAPIDVDSHMSLLFGHDRNLSEAAKYMALAAEKGCGRCFFYLGAMLALGEPETNVSARFKVLSDGNIEFRWARGLARAEGLASSSMLDRPAIAYYVGAQKGDPLAVLAFSYYVLNRLTLGSPGAAWWIAGERPQATHALRRKPWREEATPALCQLILRTLENVAETAARNEDGATDSSDLHFFVQNASEVQRAKKEHADWIRARSKDGYKEAEVVEAAYLFHGDADLNLTRNVSRALELFDAAASTTTEAAWNSMLLHAREGHESKIIQHAQNIIQDPDATALQKTMAQHYLHRFGADDTRPNSTRAGVYLLAAAELGDSNAQQMIAHAYAGLELPELENVKIPGAPNTKRAMHFYMKAAKQGRPVSAVNAVSLMLRNPEGQRSTADDRCRGAVETLRDVALAYHPEVLQLHGRARHAFDSGDEEGALISFALLSELGAKNAHTNAASLWKKGQKKTLKCWRSTSTDLTGRLCELDYRRRAALTGNVDAMLRLASLHENLGEAQHWIRKASDAGSMQAKHSIAYIQANSPSSEDRSSACMEYCKLLKLQDEPVLARGLAFLQVMRLGSEGFACCDLPIANLPSKSTILAIFASTTAAAVCLGLTCMVG